MPRIADSYGIRDMYNIFVKEFPELDIPYDLFKEVIVEHNKLATQSVLEGNRFDFGQSLSCVFVKRVKRKITVDPETGKLKGAKINHGETRKLRQQGINKVVFYTDPYYFRWVWNKTMCFVPGKTPYCFNPTDGRGGTALMLQKLVKNPINQLRFIDNEPKRNIVKANSKENSKAT